jgi:hypothetical protein
MNILTAALFLCSLPSAHLIEDKKECKKMKIKMADDIQEAKKIHYPCPRTVGGEYDIFPAYINKMK